ncbi:type II toxin-antitoxin system VapC family toxin [soil metagenome]
MITAIDTNILLDIFGADPKFGNASAEALRQCMREGAVHACEAVWVETGVFFPNEHDYLHAMKSLNIEFSSITQKTAFEAAKTWRVYRSAGGKRERIVADFLIGAHAMTQCQRLLTRDKGFYRRYFNLTILDPSLEAG